MSSTVPEPSPLGHMKSRPTVYNGVKMRSRLEAGFAQWLESVGLTWEYEPNAFATSLGQYLPDFAVRHLYDYTTNRFRDVYFEVKPGIWFDVADNGWKEHLRRWADIIASSEPDALLLVAVAPDHAMGRAIILDRSIRTFRLYRHESGNPFLSFEIAQPLTSLPWVGEWWKGDA